MPLYRQTLTINPRTRTARDLTELHKLVMAGYRHALDEHLPDARARLNVLWLADIKPTNPYRTVDGRKRAWPPKANPTGRLLVQATVPGHWDTTEYADDPELALTATDPITVDTHLDAGQHIAIRARLNPLIAHNGRRTPISNLNDAAAWAQRTLAHHGIQVDLDTATISAPTRMTGHRTTGTLTVDTRTIQANATITDPALAETALIRGVGRERAYGSGLIRHRPLTPA